MIRLFYKTENGRTVEEIHDFEPYFYVIPEDIEKLSSELKEFDKIIRIEKREMIDIKEKINVLKITVSQPGDVPELRSKIKELEHCREVREAAIPFVERYIIDSGLIPMENCEELNLRIAAFDIEVYNSGRAPKPEKDPIIMISYSDSLGLKRVWTYGKPDLDLDFVEILENEAEIIKRFIETIKKREIDIITGYNTDNFDFPYLKERAKLYKIRLDIGIDGSEVKLERRGMNLGARVRGRPHVDIYPISRQIFNLSRYQLEDVYLEVFGREKFDIDTNKMAEIWDSGDEDELRKLFRYSLSDAVSTLEIAMTLLPLQYELSRITRDLIYESSRSGSGQRVESLLMRRAHEMNILAPNKPSDRIAEERQRKSYAGAYVVEPVKGIHDNILLFDFRSLYPSIIISHNIDPSTIDCSCCPEDNYKTPTEHYFCKKKKGFIPGILNELVTKRIEIKKRLKKEKNPERRRLLDVEQHAIKLLANSAYGYYAFPRARWYSKECAEAIAALGREYIHKTIKDVESHGFRVIYGDSITKDRFVTILDQNNLVQIKNIEELFNENIEKSQKIGDKERIELNGYKALGIDTKTKKPCWTRIREIIRHRTKKDIFRVNQKYGETIVTEDHSLIANVNGNLIEIKPGSLEDREIACIERIPKVKHIKEIDVYEILKGYGYEIEWKGKRKKAIVQRDDKWVWFDWAERKNPVKVKRFIKVDSDEFSSLCRLLGAYISEGSSSTKETTDSRMGTSISSSDVEWLKQLQNDYNALFDGVKTCIIRSTRKPRRLKYSVGNERREVSYEDATYKLQMMNRLSAIFFKMFCGQKSNGKKLPDFIFHVPEKYKRLILENMIKGDGYETKSLHLISGLSFLLSQLGQKYTIQYRKDKETYRITTSSMYNTRLDTKLRKENYKGYVYDLNTDTNNFVDSCGQILLHNTDSVYIVKPDETKKENIIADANSFLEKINRELPEAMELEFEGFYPRGIFITKKRYALMDEKGVLTVKGLETRRRDWANVAKETQEKVLNALLKDKNPEKAANIVKEIVQKIKSGKISLKDLAINTQITRRMAEYVSAGPHIVAARKAIKKGLEFKQGDIVTYIVTKKGGSISDKAMVINFVEEGDYDADYYINNQVLPAVLRILETLGYSEEELKGMGKQMKLGSF